MKMDSSLKQVHIKLLKDLYESVNGLYSYTFYKRYRLTPKETFEFIQMYIEKKYIKYLEDRVSLTDLGKQQVFVKYLHNKVIKGIDSNLPINYRGNKISISTPYIPIISYLGNDFFKED